MHAHAVVREVTDMLTLGGHQIGRILRWGGAIFIRRTFSGDSDRLYSVIFGEYIQQLLARGNSIEVRIMVVCQSVGIGALCNRAGWLVGCRRSASSKEDAVEVERYCVALALSQRERFSLFDINQWPV
jgi:hypothetical protein